MVQNLNVRFTDSPCFCLCHEILIILNTQKSSTRAWDQLQHALNSKACTTSVVDKNSAAKLIVP